MRTSPQLKLLSVLLLALALGAVVLWMPRSPVLLPAPALAVRPPVSRTTPPPPEEPEPTIDETGAALQEALEEVGRMRLELLGQVSPDEVAAWQARRLQAASGFVGERLVTCDISALMVEGRAWVALPRGGMGRARRDSGIHGGRILFTALSEETAAEVTVEGVGIGMAEWPEAEPGSAVSCTRFTVELLFGWVSGLVVDEGGSPVSLGRVEGCGGSVAVDEEGRFTLQAEPGPCSVAAVARADMAEAVGGAVSVQPRAGEEVTDIRLIAPQRPEFRGPTPAEAARSAEQLCRYWTEEAAWAVALEQARLEDASLTTGERDAVVSALREARDREAQARADYCP